MIKLIVYDLDGTLIDTAAEVVESINFLLTELNKPKIRKKDILPWLSVGGQKMIENVLEISESESERYLERFRKKYLEIKTPVESIYPEVLDTLGKLQVNYRLSICTNKPRRLMEKVLIETDLIRYFNYMCAGDDLATKKPHPNNLTNCLNHFSVAANEVVLVGDSTVDQTLARSCGVKFVQYVPGYDDGVYDNPNTFKIEKHSQILEYLGVAS